ncbi:unnamed protein product [Rotaria magnacalcarata]|uniref:Apolipoprotein D n=1 Tax=Rotaria magnacalcarata TaxID=392030 RepID=A0A816QUA3_9BILA|nr:unnamed protein product [Rotaria magnacalcarata]
MFLSVITIAVFFSLTDSLKIGKCPNITTQSNFNVSQYAGLWYEAYRNTILFELGTKCVNATYTLNSDGSIGVWNQAVKFFGSRTSINGTAKVKNASEPGALSVTFPSAGTTGDYNVISTNYSDYAIVYSCSNIRILFIPFKSEYIWILSRTKTLSPLIVQQLSTTMSNLPLGFSGSGFSYANGAWKHNSFSFNGSRDLYYDDQKGMHVIEDQLIDGALESFYMSHQWRQNPNVSVQQILSSDNGSGFYEQSHQPITIAEYH